MSEIFAGVRVVEVAGWHMVPAAGAVLADFGADVIKVENPSGGDPQRNVPTPGVPESSSGVSLTIEQSNRGKRSLALDISRPDGLAVLHDLVRTADVFMTNFLPPTRRKLGIDVEGIRGVRPDIVYVRGDAVGRRGPEAGKPGFDYSVFWGRAGVAHAVAGPDALEPVTPRPGFGDRTASTNIAFGVAGALFRRGRTGEGAVVDVSLLGSGMWSNSGDLMYSKGTGQDYSQRPRGSTYHRTADGRWIIVTMPDPTRWWKELSRQLGREELIDDARFATPKALAANRAALTSELQVGFGSFTLDELRQRLGSEAPWEPVQNLLEVAADPQVVANEYFADIQQPAGDAVSVVRAPVQFDEDVAELRPAPRLGQDSLDILVDLGCDEARVAAMVRDGLVSTDEH
jgi:crotonobetainyl-CoA:carnitine CoA-transferase CaiB-like acyl-CoA transferase